MAKQLKSIRLPDWIITELDKQALQEPGETFNHLVENILTIYLRDASEISRDLKEIDSLIARKIDKYQWLDMNPEDTENMKKFQEAEPTLELLFKLMELIRQSPHFIEATLPPDFGEEDCTIN